MSGIDPFAATNNAASTADAAQAPSAGSVPDGTLDAGVILSSSNGASALGIAIDVLQAQLSLGDVLAATVLAPQGGVDLLEILGQNVVAQLPPDVYPGETLLLQVTGFQSNQILVSNLGPLDPKSPVPTVAVVVPQSMPTATPASIVSASGQRSQQSSPPVSPPRAVFVAASVRPAQDAAAPGLQRAPATTSPVAPAAADVEARIFAARAAQAETVRAQPSTEPIPVQRAAAAPFVAGRASPPAGTGTARTAEAAILSTLRIPQTPRNLAAARIASQAVAMLPRALQRLEAALPRMSTDARISTLRTLLSFVSRLDPGNERALPAQISAFVGNVLDGAESKLAQLLRAHVEEHVSPSATQPQETPRQQRGTAPQSTAQSAPQASPKAAAQDEVKSPAVVQSSAQPPVMAGARVVERSIAFEHDLKTLVLSLMHQPPQQDSPALAQALSDTLTTLTGAQLGALSVNANDPAAMTLSLPVFFHDSGQATRIRIDRDAPGRKERLDADNFHVSFVLDTAALGTVAIDLETAGRQVKVNVKTEREPAADRFRSTLVDLGKRLEQLRYRVSSMNASVAPPLTATPVRHLTDAKRRLDVQV
ncbi:MAG: flagellar hook-length control protein FliK [Vulcanimicrobiaceae bacterium]